MLVTVFLLLVMRRHHDFTDWTGPGSTLGQVYPGQTRPTGYNRDKFQEDERPPRQSGWSQPRSTLGVAGHGGPNSVGGLNQRKPDSLDWVV